MKRRELLKMIYREASRKGVSNVTLREGGRHSIVTLSNLNIPIPRHREIGDLLAMQIMKECEPVFGGRWWRHD